MVAAGCGCRGPPLLSAPARLLHALCSGVCTSLQIDGRSGNETSPWYVRAHKGTQSIMKDARGCAGLLQFTPRTGPIRGRERWGRERGRGIRALEYWPRATLCSRRAKSTSERGGMGWVSPLSVEQGRMGVLSAVRVGGAGGREWCDARCMYSWGSKWTRQSAVWE